MFVCMRVCLCVCVCVCVCVFEGDPLAASLARLGQDSDDGRPAGRRVAGRRGSGQRMPRVLFGSKGGCGPARAAPVVTQMK